MNLRVQRNIFLKEIQKIQSITPIKGTKPILSCFLLETTETGLYLYATDLNVGLKVFLPAEITVQGKTCLPARVVYDIVRELPEGSVIDAVLEDNKRARFSCINSVFHVPYTDTTEFPPFPSFDVQQMHEVPLDLLVNMFEKINITVPVIEQKIYDAPAGALFAVDDKGIEMAGTDGLRMAYMRLDGVPFPIQMKTVIPKKLLDELPKMLADWDQSKKKHHKTTEKEASEGQAMEKNQVQEDAQEAEPEDERIAPRFGLTENNIFFSWPDNEVFACLMENKFPDYKEPIAVQNDKVIILDCERFRQAVRRVSLISEKKEWFIRFILSPGKMFLDSEKAEIGDAHDEIEIDYDGEPFEIGFNPRYILDFLSVIDSPQVSLEMTDNESLAILKPKDQDNIKFIIMPVRL